MPSTTGKPIAIRRERQGRECVRVFRVELLAHIRSLEIQQKGFTPQECGIGERLSVGRGSQSMEVLAARHLPAGKNLPGRGFQVDQLATKPTDHQSFPVGCKHGVCKRRAALLYIPKKGTCVGIPQDHFLALIAPPARVRQPSAIR